MQNFDPKFPQTLLGVLCSDPHGHPSCTLSHPSARLLTLNIFGTPPPLDILQNHFYTTDSLQN